MKMNMMFLLNKLMFQKMSYPRCLTLILKAKNLKILKLKRDCQSELRRIIPLKISYEIWINELSPYPERLLATHILFQRLNPITSRKLWLMNYGSMLWKKNRVNSKGRRYRNWLLDLKIWMSLVQNGFSRTNLMMVWMSTVHRPEDINVIDSCTIEVDTDWRFF